MTDFPTLIRFVVVGGSTAFLQLGLLWFLADLMAMPIVIASTIALVLAAAYNYMFHYHWTFAVEIPHGIAMAKYLLMCVGALGLNMLVMHVGVSVLHFHYVLVQVVAGTLVVIWSFSLSSFWVFPDKG